MTILHQPHLRNACGTALAVAIALAATAAGADPVTIGYFAQWDVYGANYLVKNIETSGSAARLSIINYAFAQIGSGNAVATTDAYADYQRTYSAQDSVDGIADPLSGAADLLCGSFNQLRKLKARHPGLKVVMSIGGWTLSGPFSAMAMTAASRQAFAASCVTMYIQGNFAPGLTVPGIFDGIDIDWEYPAAAGATTAFSPSDTRNYTLLLAALRSALDQQGAVDGRHYLLSAALPAGSDKYSLIELGAISGSLDYLNIMAYDFFGAWESTTGFQAALYSRPDDPYAALNYNGDHAVTAYRAAGVPAGKIVLGVPFYGRGWQGVPPGAGGNGLFQTSTGGAPGTVQTGVNNYSVLKSVSGTAYRDPTTLAYWIYQPTTGVWWNFDDPTAVQAKMAYIASHQLGGAMVWELSGDDANGSLIAALQPGAATVVPSGSGGSGSTTSGPAIAAIPDQTIPVGGALTQLPILLSDSANPGAPLMVSGSSSEQSVVADAAVVITGGGDHRQLSITPVAGQSGRATITLTISDGTRSASSAFQLTVGAGATAGSSAASSASAGGGGSSSGGRCGAGAWTTLLGMAVLALVARRRRRSEVP